MGREDAQTVQMLLDVLGDDVDRSVCIEAVELSRFFVEVHDWLCLLVEHVQSLDDGLLVVVRPAASLSSLKQPSLEFLLRALKVNDRLEIDPLRHFLLPDIHVLLAPRKPVKEVSASEIVAFNLLADELDHEAARDQLPLFHNGAQLLSERRSCLDLLTEQVACRQMDEIVFLHKHIALAKLSKVVRTFA